MKAITVQQPWAWAIIHGGKHTENRTRLGTWTPLIGQRIAIHAGKRWSDRGAEFPPLQHAYAAWLGFQHWGGTYGGRTALPIDPRTEERDRELIDFGAIIGTAFVADVHPADPDPTCCEPWGEAAYREHDGMSRHDIVHIELAQPRSIDPIPCRGALGVWRLPDHIAREIEAVTVR